MVGTGFSTEEVTGMLGMTPSRLRSYVRAGLLCPQRGQDGALRFSFQDLLLLRTAEGLVTERLPPRRVRAALQRLRRILPASRPLTGVQLAGDHGQVVVHDEGRRWCADSGQVLLPFPGAAETRPATLLDEAPPIALKPRALEPRAGDEPAAASPPREPFGDVRVVGEAPSGEDFFQLGCALESGSPEAARVAYERALLLQPGHADAHVNLGRLSHEGEELRQAEEHYRAALALDPRNVTALYNLGVLMEDAGRVDDAMSTYEQVTHLDPRHADAHFNAARLHDVAGHYEAALRHLRAYRNLSAE